MYSKARLALGLIILFIIVFLGYHWLNDFVKDLFLSILVFLSLFVFASNIVAKIFGWGKLHYSDERDEYIHAITIMKAVNLWFNIIFVAVIVFVVLAGYGFLEINEEFSGFIKGLGVSALTYVVFYIVSFAKIYKMYS